MDLRLEKNLTFTEANVRENILLPFRTEREYDRLVVQLHYTPKVIRDPEVIVPQIQACVKRYFPAGYELTEEDMKEYDALLNFVTLSLDKDGAYVGCAHRHPEEQLLTISADGSSWGFAPTAVTPADWRIVLHVQAVVVGTIDYKLRVYGMERGESDAQIPTL